MFSPEFCRPTALIETQMCTTHGTPKIMFSALLHFYFESIFVFPLVKPRFAGDYYKTVKCETNSSVKQKCFSEQFHLVTSTTHFASSDSKYELGVNVCGVRHPKMHFHQHTKIAEDCYQSI